MVAPRSILVTGSNRGIGLELVSQLTKLDPSPQVILAACRNPETAQELQELSRQYSSVKVLQLDVENEESIQSAYKETCSLVGTSGLNVVVNNAGINLSNASIRDVNTENLLRSFKVNLVGPAIIAKTFLPLLRQAAGEEGGELSWSRAAIINLSSNASSITDNVAGAGRHYGYRESKAALNQLTRNLCMELSPQGILATCIHPGWVQTDMGSVYASLTKQDSILGMISVFENLNKESAGKLLTFDGGELPW